MKKKKAKRNGHGHQHTSSTCRQPSTTKQFNKMPTMVDQSINFKTVDSKKMTTLA